MHGHMNVKFTLHVGQSPHYNCDAKCVIFRFATSDDSFLSVTEVWRYRIKLTLFRHFLFQLAVCFSEFRHVTIRIV